MSEKKILEVGHSNYKNLTPGTLDVSGATALIVGGPNGAGKTSFRQIFNVLAQRGESEEPLRHGTKKGHYYVKVMVDGAVYRVERHFRLKDGVITDHYKLNDESGAALKDEDGSYVNKSRRAFNEIFNAPIFDPVSFTSLSQAKMVDLVLELAGNKEDAEKLEEEFKELYNKRHEIGVERKVKGGALENLGASPLPHNAEKKDISELYQKLAAAKNVDKTRKDLEDKFAQLTTREERIKADIERLNNELESVIQDMANTTEALMNTEAMDVEEIQKEIDQAGGWNRAVDRKKEREALAKEFEALDEKYKEYDRSIADVKERKVELLDGIELPDERLFLALHEKPNGRTEYRLKYRLDDGNEVLFQEGDLNTAKMYEVAIRLRLAEIAQDEKFPLLRIDAAPLDDTTLETLIEMLRENGVFGVIEKAKGRQGIDTLDIQVIE
jgi:energy-coupling factor transporter ATP-binding protein EcfA2